MPFDHLDWVITFSGSMCPPRGAGDLHTTSHRPASRWQGQPAKTCSLSADNQPAGQGSLVSLSCLSPCLILSLVSMWLSEPLWDGGRGFHPLRPPRPLYGLAGAFYGFPKLFKKNLHNRE